MHLPIPTSLILVFLTTFADGEKNVLVGAKLHQKDSTNHTSFADISHFDALFLEKNGNVTESEGGTDFRLTTTSISDHKRRKRAVFNLGSMVDCVTPCHPLAYAGYGCFCGYLGSGRAVDGIDRCCYEHDWCYSKVSCPSILIYFMPYYWKCNRGKPLCNSKGLFGWKSKCGRQLCECDRRFALCLRRYRCPRSRRLCKSSKISMVLNNFLMLGK